MHLEVKRVNFLIPSIAHFLFLILFLQLSLNVGNRLLVDGDTGIHIRMGSIILEERALPSFDHFSYGSPPHSWSTHEWLSQVIMSVVHDSFGLTGIVIFFITLISFTYSLFFVFMRHNKDNILMDILLFLIVILSSQISWTARPHIFSILFSTIVLRILNTFQYSERSHLYWLPLITLFWVNLHGGFIVSILLISIFLVGNLFNGFISKGVEKEVHWKAGRSLFLTLLACLLASLVNPSGYHAITIPFQVVSDQLLMDNVQEFLSPNFHKPIFYKYLLMLMIAVLSVSRMRLDAIELSLILVFTYMSLYSARHIALFAVIAAPIMSKYMDLNRNEFLRGLSPAYSRRSSSVADIDARSGGYLWPVAAVLVIIVMASRGDTSFKFEEKNLKPMSAVEFLKKERLEGNMFNLDEFGDYMIYALYPQHKVFIDSRHEIYMRERFQDYLDVISLKPGWDKILDKYDINWIIFNKDSFLSRFLSNSEAWKPIYSDPMASIFVKNKPENQDLIMKYRQVGRTSSRGWGRDV